MHAKTSKTLDAVGGVSDDGAVTLDDVAADLYSGLPGGFVARRDEAARSAQSAGDRILAGLIGKLRKPTVGAWLGNLLAYHHPADVAELTALGDELRAAQEQLDAAAMRDLGKRRQQLVRSLVSQARATATELGEPPGGPALQELEATLVAAVADPDAAAQLTAGRLTTGLSYAGFGAFGAAASMPAPSTKPAAASAKKTVAGKSAAATAGRETADQKAAERSAEIDAAERDLAQARLQAAQAEEDVDAATDAEASAKAALAELEARAAELRKELDAVQDSITSNRKKLAWATTERKNAKATVAELARLVATAERALARITRS